MTGKEQALAILRDGRPHSNRELYSKLRANPNVISKLREDGYVINCERRDGQWWYQLLTRLDGSAYKRPEPAPLLDGSKPVLAENQMSLEDVL